MTTGGRACYVALGDSVTVGLGDPLPGGGWRGWSALLAEGLPSGATFHNLATSGALAATVRAEQLPLALAHRPTMVSVLAGVNDTLRGRFDPLLVAEHLAVTVAVLRARGVVVLTATMPDPGRMFGLPRPLGRVLARRVGQLNDAMDRIAERYATLHLDLATHPATYEPRMWSVDRLHPSELGHRMVARQFAALVAGSGHQPVAMPSAMAGGGATVSLAGHLAWLAVHGSAWLWARSRDLAPQLVALAVGEWWAERRGRAVPIGTVASRSWPALTDVRLTHSDP